MASPETSGSTDLLLQVRARPPGTAREQPARERCVAALPARRDLRATDLAVRALCRLRLLLLAAGVLGGDALEPVPNALLNSRENAVREVQVDGAGPPVSAGLCRCADLHARRGSPPSRVEQQRRELCVIAQSTSARSGRCSYERCSLASRPCALLQLPGAFRTDLRWRVPGSARAAAARVRVERAAAERATAERAANPPTASTDGRPRALISAAVRVYRWSSRFAGLWSFFVFSFQGRHAVLLEAGGERALRGCAPNRTRDFFRVHAIPGRPRPARSGVARCTRARAPPPGRRPPAQTRD